MKSLLFNVLGFLPLVVFGQSGDFEVTSKVGTLNAPAKAYLVYNLLGGDRIDSAEIVQGVALFKGSITDPAQAAIIIDHKGEGLHKIQKETADFLSFYLESGKTSLTSSDSIAKAKITGSKLNDDNQRLKTALLPIEKKTKLFFQEAEAVAVKDQQSGDFRKKMDRKFEAIQEEHKAVLKKFIREHPNSFLSLQVIQMYGGAKPDPAELEGMFNSLAANIKDSATGRALQSEIAGLNTNGIGTEAMNFTQNDPDGKPISLASFRGSYVLIDFWASWCGPCRMENPNLVNAFQKFKDKNFTILGVSLDKEKSRWLKAITDDKLSWPQVSDLKSWQNEVAVMYGVRAIPFNLLIDPEGKIVAKNLRGEELNAKLSEILK